MTPPQSGHRGLFDIMGDSVDIFGHRVPVSVLGVLATLATVLVVMRARSSGSNLVSAGSGSTSASSSALQQLALQNQSSIASLQTAVSGLANQVMGGLSGSPAPTQSTAPTSPGTAPSTSPNPVLDLTGPTGIATNPGGPVSMPRSGGSASVSRQLIAINTGLGAYLVQPDGSYSPITSAPSGVAYVTMNPNDFNAFVRARQSGAAA